MRKTTAIFFLLLLLFNGIGLHLFYTIQRSQLRQEMKAYLQRNIHPAIEEIVLSEQNSNELSWEDKEEFNYKGQMYDLISLTTSENKTVIRCIKDKKESVLIAKFQEHNQSQSDQKAKAWIKLLILIFLDQSREESNSIVIESSHYILHKAAPIQDQSFPLLKPPANLV